MQKKDKLIMIGIMAGAFIFIAVVLVVTGVFKLHVNTPDKASELGSITKTADDYDETQEYVQQYDEVIETSEPIFVDIQNMELVFNMLTLQAIEDLDKDLSSFLLTKGYKEDTHISFSISQSSIVYDKSYPYFELVSQNKDVEIPTIKASYYLPEYTWQFEFK